jgi:hypothetical protein
MFWGILAIAVIVLVVLAVLKSKSAPVNEDYPCERQAALFTPAERSFLGVLEQAVGNEFRIFAKVRLADLISVRKGLSKSDWQKAVNRISAKHIDFVLCAKDNLAAVCAIELDDRSHEKTNRQKRDQNIADMLNAASLPLVRVKAQAAYAVQGVRNEVDRALGRGLGASSAPEAVTTQEEKKEEVEEAVPGRQEKLCPKCSAPMVLRKATKGEHAGKVFWGCSNYPKCRTFVRAAL